MRECMAHFPTRRYLQAPFGRRASRGGIHDVEIEGELPPQLSGTYHRVHPDAQFPPILTTTSFSTATA